VSVKVDLSGFDIARDKLFRIDRMHQKMVLTTLTGIIGQLSGTRSGQLTTYHGQPHRASAPGEAPAARSGNLRTSLISTRVAPYYYMISMAYYGLILERDKDRPFALRASEKAWSNFVTMLERYLNGS
jgi:hypothetical protein